MDKIEEKLWQRVERFRKVFQAVPFVRMIAVCNNLSFGCVDGKSDIDLFVMAKKGRLFIVRAFLTLCLHVFGVRRYGDKVSGRFCLSFFVDESHLNLSKIAIKNDIYLAYWIYKIVPVVDGGVLCKFENKNKWILQVLKKDDFTLRKDRLKLSFVLSPFIRIFLEILMLGPIGSFVEKVLKNWQTKRAKAKASKLKNRGGIVISDNILKFHNEDGRLYFRDKCAGRFDESKFISLLKGSREN